MSAQDKKVVEKDGKFFPPESFSKTAQIKNWDEYESLYRRSVEDPSGFWAEEAEKYYWNKKWENVSSCNFDINKGPVDIRWFEGGQTNLSYNCLDRNLEKYGHKTALIWEGNDTCENHYLTYRELHREVCRFANVLKKQGLKKGDRVALYMPMVSEAVIAMLGCARIGVVHSVVFGGFSAESLAGRILDSECRMVITADGVYRGHKLIRLKDIADTAMDMCSERGHKVESCIVYRRLDNSDFGQFTEGRDHWWDKLMEEAGDECEPVWMDAEDPLFILYTSGSTGKPKGILHTTAGYMVYTGTTFRNVFDVKDDDIYWCTADVGWITGHSYIVYGPLLNATTVLLFEGVPTYPDAGRFWNVVEKHHVTLFYTAPTAIRALAAQGDHHVTKYSRCSLRVLGTVGEPINDEAWRWYHEVVGEGRCPIVDTWWQTETGGILLSPLPGATPTKPGSATFPQFGVQPVVLDPHTHKEIKGEGEGVLAFKTSWPGQLRTVYGDHKRFEKTYFSDYPGYYFSGDGVRRDADGYYWISGRVDDVLNVSGHRLGTAEVESALDSHSKVAEAAVVGYPHDIKGQGIFAYVILNSGAEHSKGLEKELITHVREEIGPFAAPDKIVVVEGLPKTRSGKIMRRILRKIAAGQTDELGDITTLADPSVVDTLKEKAQKA